MEKKETESLKEQSTRIKQKVNAEVEGLYDKFMELSLKEPAPSEETQRRIERLQGVISRIEWLKKVKDSICE